MNTAYHQRWTEADRRARARMQQAADRARAFQVVNAFDLDRQERLELASLLFDREVTSWTELSADEWGRIRDALEGAAYVCQIQMERRNRRRGA